MPPNYLCNLVIPGAAKSGTSSLHEYLDAHPQIAMSNEKEPHHFCRDDKYPLGAAAHNGLFVRRTETRYYGESSTGYLPWPPAADRITHDLNHPKAIIVLRHPLDRAFSHYRWRFRLGLETRSFMDAVTEDGYGYDPERGKGFGYTAYLEFSNYSKHCPTWESRLGPDNCLFIAAEHMREDPTAALNACFAFLKLEPMQVAQDHGSRNETATLGRRMPKTVTHLARFLPESLRTNTVVQKVKSRLLQAAAPEPPKSMTEEERIYVNRMLAEDIAWYEARFAAADTKD